MQDKRKYPRLDVNVNIHWQKTIKPGNSTSESRDVTKNISAGGICLIVYEKVEVDDRLKLEFELPTQKLIRCDGRVAWVKEFEIIGRENAKRYDIGVEFFDINAEDRDEIKKFVFSFLDVNSV
jgi:c-di-GMP-binding flagellar brake protein YcgR